MKILFLGDVVGLSGCRKITNDLLDQIQKNNIDFAVSYTHLRAHET